MNEISPNLKAAIGEVERVAETLSNADQDQIAKTIRDAVLSTLPLPGAIRPLLDDALDDIAAGRVTSWDDVKSRISAKLLAAR